MARVRMYTRDGCGLCDVAREVLLAVRERIPFELEEVDVEGDDALELEYGLRIPVVIVEEDELFELVVDPEVLARALLETPGAAGRV
jgi:glutaredoxin